MIGRQQLPRLLTLCLLLVLIGIACYVFFATPEGRRITSNPHVIGQDVRHWVAAHWVIAPIAFVATYIVLVILALPIWWLQILGGYGFGLVMGVIWSEAAATLGATAAVLLSRWLAGEWFHRRIEARIARLHTLNERLGHNGLLVVMAVRLVHVLPFGLSNYAFGLIGISPIDVAAGTLLGNLPAALLDVTLGANRHLLAHWRFITGLVLLNAVLLVPLVLRYLRPNWFRRLGIE